MNVQMSWAVTVGAAMCLLFTSLTATSASAQTGAASGMLAQGNQCLEIEGSSSSTKTPKVQVGIRVVVNTCSGLPGQQWTVLMGDYDDILFKDSNLRLSATTKGKEGKEGKEGKSKKEVTIALGKSGMLGWRYSSTSWSWIRTHDNQCLTVIKSKSKGKSKSKSKLDLRACADSDKRQQWTLR